MFWMRAYPLGGKVGGGWALEFESFLGPVKWHRAVFIKVHPVQSKKRCRKSAKLRRRKPSVWKTKCCGGENQINALAQL